MQTEAKELRIDDVSLWEKENFLFEKLFGFKIVFPKESEIKRIVKENEFRTIYELKNNELAYSLNFFSPLSIPETIFLYSLLEKIQEEKSSAYDFQKEVELFSEQNSLSFELWQKENIANYLSLLTSSQGILNHLLSDTELEEISLIGLHKKLRIYHNIFGWVKTNILFTNPVKVIELVNSLVLHENKSISFSKPVLNSILKDGSRINAMANPTSNTAVFTIRKFNFSRMTPFSLIKSSAFSSELLAFLSLAIQSNSSIITSGNTGSGKTTALNSLLSFLGKEERIIVIEETPELLIPQNHFIKLKSVQELGIKLNELITESLRARPDVLILGEIRNADDIQSFINALLSGQAKSCLTTMHSFSANDCIQRLRHLGAKESELLSIDLILILKRISRIKKASGKRFEERKALELAEVIPDKKGNISLNPLYEFNFSSNSFKKKNESIKVKEKITQVFSFSKKEFTKELCSRTKFFEEHKNDNLSLNEFSELLKKEGVAW